MKLRSYCFDFSSADCRASRRRGPAVSADVKGCVITFECCEELIANAEEMCDKI